MNRLPLSIITASAGTGKTYRLALEYLRIVLDFYDHQDFSLDNILALTFTKKATAEIRDRIIQHLELLATQNEDKRIDRNSLLTALYPESHETNFGIREQNIVLSAIREIASDRKQLQVMTIDAYIGSIFRNIVGPMRGIDSYSIDENAVDKRMPYLLDYLMKSEMRGYLDDLLRRKISPSLDKYRSLFKHLIDQRWIYYLIMSQTSAIPEASLHFRMRRPDSQMTAKLLDDVYDLIEQIISHLASLFPGEEPRSLFNKNLRDLIPSFPSTYPALFQALKDLCLDLIKCHQLMKAGKKSFFNANKFRAKNFAEAKEIQQSLHQALIRALADYLVPTLFIPEQMEILAIWKQVLDEYDRLVFKYKNLTYNDVSWLTLDALFGEDDAASRFQEPNVANEFYLFLSHRSRFILIDEFQDTSLIQFSILKPIIGEIISGQGSKDFSGLVVVGDEKQSIFGWRGGERKLLLNFGDIFQPLRSVRPEVLDRSFRSSPAMMDFINALFMNKDIHDYLAERNLEWKYAPIESAVVPAVQTSIEFIPMTHGTAGADVTTDTVMRCFVQNSIKPAIEAHPEEEIAIICRKTKEISALQQMLEEAGVASIFQPSDRLIEHLWVKPLYHWLKFLAFRDWLDFLSVLRSNYFMLKAAPLKQLADIIAQSKREGNEPDFSVIPTVDFLYQHSRKPFLSMSQACLDIVDARFELVAPTERDMLNIHAFVSLIKDFELSISEHDKSIPAFLDYLDDNSTQDFLKQVAVEGKGTLQLLTIHKSKGLQFDRVFVYYDLSSPHGNDFGKLHICLDYASPDFQELNDFALSYHYQDILAQSSYSQLVENEKNRELLEELNNLYVAFTRAKTSLHICMTRRGQDSAEDAEVKTQGTARDLPLLLKAAIGQFYKQNDIEPDVTGVYMYKDTFREESQQDINEAPREIPAFAYRMLTLPPFEAISIAEEKANDPNQFLNMRQVWLQDKPNLFGDLAHLYLSKLVKDTVEEHKRATMHCFLRFGAILSQKEILDTIETLRQRIPREKIFADGYDKVFTEFTLYLDGKELRIDRLLLDTYNKRALILDYKTGRIHDSEQLEIYKRALHEYKAIRDGCYTVDIDYISIDIRS